LSEAYKRVFKEDYPEPKRIKRAIQYKFCDPKDGEQVLSWIEQLKTRLSKTEYAVFRRVENDIEALRKFELRKTEPIRKLKG
jgi:hypothetical protein